MPHRDDELGRTIGGRPLAEVPLQLLGPRRQLADPLHLDDHVRLARQDRPDADRDRVVAVGGPRYREVDEVVVRGDPDAILRRGVREAVVLRHDDRPRPIADELRGALAEPRRRVGEVRLPAKDGRHEVARDLEPLLARHVLGVLLELEPQPRAREGLLGTGAVVLAEPQAQGLAGLGRAVDRPVVRVAVRRRRPLVRPVILRELQVRARGTHHEPRELLARDVTVLVPRHALLLPGHVGRRHSACSPAIRSLPRRTSACCTRASMSALPSPSRPCRSLVGTARPSPWSICAALRRSSGSSERRFSTMRRPSARRSPSVFATKSAEHTVPKPSTTCGPALIAPAPRTSAAPISATALRPPEKNARARGRTLEAIWLYMIWVAGRWIAGMTIRSAACSSTAMIRPAPAVRPTIVPAPKAKRYQSGNANITTDTPKRRMRPPVRNVWMPSATIDPLVWT